MTTPRQRRVSSSGDFPFSRLITASHSEPIVCTSSSVIGCSADVVMTSTLTAPPMRRSHTVASQGFFICFLLLYFIFYDLLKSAKFTVNAQAEHNISRSTYNFLFINRNRVTITKSSNYHRTVLLYVLVNLPSTSCQ